MKTAKRYQVVTNLGSKSVIFTTKAAARCMASIWREFLGTSAGVKIIEV